MSDFTRSEIIPGQSWLAGQSGITAGMATYDGITVYAGSVGIETLWTLEV